MAFRIKVRCDMTYQSLTIFSLLTAVAASNAYAQPQQQRRFTLDSQLKVGESVGGLTSRSKRQACDKARVSWQRRATRILMQKVRVASGQFNTRSVGPLSPARETVPCSCFAKGFKTKCYVTSTASATYRWTRSEAQYSWPQLQCTRQVISVAASHLVPWKARAKVSGVFASKARTILLVKARARYNNNRLVAVPNSLTPRKQQTQRVCSLKGFKTKCRVVVTRACMQVKLP